MRKWNGWGDENTVFPTNQYAEELLQNTVGNGQVLSEAMLPDVLKQVPVSRLPAHPLIKTEAEIRVRHARGQSLPDWLAMRSGEIGVFPDGVAEVESSEQVRILLDFAQAQDFDIIPYGGGTSVAGHINPLAGRRPVLTLSMAKMNKLLALDEVSQIATIGAGANGPQVEALLNEHGYTLGHFPQSFELSTIGGWIASRSSGQQSLRYGRIEQMFAGGRLETLKGTLDIATIPASSAGPDLREMVLGSEGRMGILTEVKVRVSRLAEKEVFHVWFLPSWEKASQALRNAAQLRVPASMMRLSNAEETKAHLTLAGHPKQVGFLTKVLNVLGLREGQRCMVTIGYTGTTEQVAFAKKSMRKILKAAGGFNTGYILGKKWEASRFRSPYLRESLWNLGYAVDTVETSVDWKSVTATMNEVENAIRNALNEEGEKVLVFTHLSHFYSQGSSIYTTYMFRNKGDYEDTLRRWRLLKSAASNAIVKMGGTISHQHGVGRDHAPYLSAEKTPLGMDALTQMVRFFDPEKRLNPGKLLMDE
jgi:alkyldihydroxyacetonephosphate synthase